MTNERVAIVVALGRFKSPLERTNDVVVVVVDSVRLWSLDVVAAAITSGRA